MPKQRPRFTIDKLKASESVSKVQRYRELADARLYAELRKAGLADP